MNENPQSTILVFSDDWGRHPSSCQHLIRCLLDRHRVLWVNTIGMRTPHLDAATMKRAFEKFGHWLRPAPKQQQALPPNLQVLNPRMWPWQRTAFDRSLNRRLLARQLRPYLERLDPPAVAVTTVPVVADLVGALPVARWLYYCVDDFSKWPGLDLDALDRLERDLAARVDVCVAVSETLRNRLAAMGRTSHLLTHGVDRSFWAEPETKNALSALEEFERPWFVFWGLKDRRLDIEMLRQLSADLQQGTILLVGPEADPDPAVARLPRVRMVTPLAYEELPALGREAAVLIMPYADLPVTRAMQPLKLKEYLATGRPVVARRLPALDEWHDCLDLVETPAEFSRAARARAQQGLSPEQCTARARLAGEDWTAKALELERWLYQGAEEKVESRAVPC